MSYNGSGLFQINTSGQPVVAGTVITASAFNALTADLATGLTTAITKDGQTATTAQIPFAQGLRSTLVTDSTTSTSGSIITDGGLGVAKAVNIGTTLGVTGAVTGSSTITGTKLIPTGTSVTGNGMYLPAANTLGFSTNGTNAVTIDASQNVGVGVTPSAWSGVTAFQNKSASVAVTSNGNNMDLATNRYYNGTSDLFYQTGNYALMYEQASGSGSHRWFTSTATGTAGNAVTFTQAMTLDANGALLMGMTSAIGTERINIQGKTGSGQDYNILTTGATSGVTAYAMRMFSSTASAVVGSIQFTSSSTSYNPSSDISLKTNITPIRNGLERVSKLKPVDYNWIADGTFDNGFIAQDLLATEEFAHRAHVNDVKNDGTKVYGVDYMKFVAVLTAAIQEQQALITQLQADVAALKGAA